MLNINLLLNLQNISALVYLKHIIEYITYTLLND